MNVRQKWIPYYKQTNSANSDIRFQSCCKWYLSSFESLRFKVRKKRRSQTLIKLVKIVVICWTSFKSGPLAVGRQRKTCLLWHADSVFICTLCFWFLFAFLSVFVCTLCFWFLFASLLVRCLISDILCLILIFHTKKEETVLS